jgi:hypothetical protein
MEVNEQIPQPGTVWLLLGKNKDAVDIWDRKQDYLPRHGPNAILTHPSFRQGYCKDGPDQPLLAATRSLSHSTLWSLALGLWIGVRLSASLLLRDLCVRCFLGLIDRKGTEIEGAGDTPPWVNTQQGTRYCTSDIQLQFAMSIYKDKVPSTCIITDVES